MERLAQIEEQPGQRIYLVVHSARYDGDTYILGAFESEKLAQQRMKELIRDPEYMLEKDTMGVIYLTLNKPHFESVT